MTSPTPASPPAHEPLGFRERVMPRTALGLAVLMLFTSLGAAFSGAVLFAYFQVRLDQNESTLTSLVNDFDSSVAEARDTIAEEQDKAKDQIRKELEPLEQLAATGDTLSALLEKAAPSVWFVITRDEAGAPSVGSAFVVASDREQTYLVTSFDVVSALTAQPAPTLKVRLGADERGATLWTWDEARDLALLVVDVGNQPRLEWAGSPGSIGDRVFALSGLGSGGGAITQGSIADVSSVGIQHDATVGNAFRGGPVINSQGEVIAVASVAYAPLGFVPGDVTFGIPISDSCQAVLRCPNGQPGGAGDRR